MRSAAHWGSLVLFLLPWPASAQTGLDSLPATSDRPRLTQSSAADVQRRLAVTFDDLPWVGEEAEDSVDAWTDRLLASLIGWRVPAVGFVNERNLQWHTQLRTRRLARWLASGMELGNHTYAHRSANNIPLSEYQVDILRGERAIRVLSRDHGAPLRYFRHPYLHTGPDTAYRDALERFLAVHGYRTAPATMVPRDWVYAQAYIEAHRRSDAELVRKVGQEYLAHIVATAAFFEEYSRELLGYEPPQILLLHANRLNAHHLGPMLTVFRRRGYQFVTLEEAQRDPAYALPVGGDPRDSVSWLQRWGAGLGKASSPAPLEVNWIKSLADTRDGRVRVQSSLPQPLLRENRASSRSGASRGSISR